MRLHMFGPHLEVGGTAPTLAALCSDLPDPKDVVSPKSALLLTRQHVAPTHNAI